MAGARVALEAFQKKKERKKKKNLRDAPGVSDCLKGSGGLGWTGEHNRRQKVWEVGVRRPQEPGTGYTARARTHTHTAHGMRVWYDGVDTTDALDVVRMDEYGH